MNVTIVGSGFGGVKAALELAEDQENHITVITDKPDFQYYPALFSTATGYRHLQSWVPLGVIFAGKSNIRVVLDTVTAIDPEAKVLTGTNGTTYTYETCILALGMVTTYFGIKGLDTYAYGIKSADEIKRLKHHIYQDIAEHGKLDKHYVIVGAGPTGVELAAALGVYLRALCQKFKVRDHNLRVDLIEAAPRILPRMSERASKKVEKRLKALGVHVQTGKAVESATAEDLVVSGKHISSRTVIWTSGVTNNPFYANNAKHFTLAKNGKVEVDEYMRAAKSLYVIGDNASTQFSGLAQTALHDALFVTGNLKRKQKHQTLKKYKAVQPPVVVPVGHSWAVLEWHGLLLSGRIAAFVRRMADLIGYRDILPLGHALGVWRASYELEDDYFESTPR
jgi:NADH dehydrogenase FAD-containing subunit